jgi:hypothetical protein
MRYAWRPFEEKETRSKMESEVQIHLMVPIAGRPTLRELFANHHEVLVHATTSACPSDLYGDLA